jgi:hypothetical protein
MIEYTYRCNQCPFSTSDPMSKDGHENHAPAGGWLGHSEQHTMYNVLERRAQADAQWSAAAHTGSCWSTHPGSTHLEHIRRTNR